MIDQLLDWLLQLNAVTSERDQLQESLNASKQDLEKKTQEMQAQHDGFEKQKVRLCRYN